MTGAWRTLGRLLVLQASWTYERLQGVGVGFASLPLLDELRRDPARYRAAVGRAAEYFNAHPYLAGIAVGAAAKAELTEVPGPTIQRLKTALAGPLGALGDQLFWIGAVPLIMGLLLGGVAFGAGTWVVAVGFATYLTIRLAVTLWGLRLGLRSGLGVSAALKASGLQGIVHRVGLAAGFVVGAAVPLVAEWFAAASVHHLGLIAMALGGAAGVVAALVRRRVPTSRQLTLVAVAGVLLWHWSVR